MYEWRDGWISECMVVSKYKAHSQLLREQLFTVTQIWEGKKKAYLKMFIILSATLYRMGKWRGLKGVCWRQRERESGAGPEARSQHLGLRLPFHFLSSKNYFILRVAYIICKLSNCCCFLHIEQIGICVLLFEAWFYPTNQYNFQDNILVRTRYKHAYTTCVHWD